MKMFEYIKEDWLYRLPYRVRHNRYRGVNRPAYAFWCFVYYVIKDALLLYVYFIFRFFKFVFWDIWNWIFKLDQKKPIVKIRNWWTELKIDNGWGDWEDYINEDEDDEDDYDSDSFWNTAISVENMDGAEFEHFCADLLRINGYTNVRVIAGSGDQSIDILADKDDMKWAFQCKRWGQENHVGNDVVQKTFAGKAFYHCDIAAVITTSTFTRKAEEYARETGILLWGQDKLYRLMEKMDDTAQTQ